MINRININLYRGISSLGIEDFSQVNVFVGGNGTGKTTILESICLISNPNWPAGIGTLGLYRELPKLTLQNDEALSTIFHGGDATRGPSFEYSVNSRPMRLLIKTASPQGQSPVMVDINASPIGGEFNPSGLRGAEFINYATPTQPFTSRLILHPGGAQQLQGHAPNLLGSFYIHARRATSVGETARLLTALSRVNKKEMLLNAFKTIDERVVDIEAGAYGSAPTVLVDLGLKIKFPINIMGDGFCRASLMATGLVSNGASLIVDEIDSGLHQRWMARTWLVLSRLAKAQNKQIFCTTHNEEMLLQLVDAFRESPNSIRVFRLDKKPDQGLVVTKYTYDDLLLSKETGTDIR